MKIIYHCYGGSHSSVLAAALHLKLIKATSLPSYTELFNLPYFDKTCDADFGSIRKVGVDELGNEVFVLGKKDLGTRYNKILPGLASLIGANNELLAVDLIGKINWLMKIGGYSSRKLGLVTLGRFFIFFGTKISFYEIVDLVDRVKKQLDLRRNNHENTFHWH
ncbi:MAG TPA: DUF3189 family protein [Syntrophomonadaceae bacterium]|nr:DUF3189 family protein [Syntrophomonadaceae bacterium]